MQLPSLSVSLGLLAFTFPAAADTFVLKNGSKVEGVILHEDATTYTLEVMVTKSIKDERAVAKADVVKIEREDPGQKTFAAIGALTPTPDALTAEEYAQMIRKTEKFLRDYPTSLKSKAAMAILATLKVEANEVLAGGIKLNGKIIPSEERAANRYAIDALVQKAKILRLVNESNSLQALRAFSEMNKDFRNTTAYSELVPLMQQVITSYMQEIGQSLATLEARIKEQNVGLERMSTVDRHSTETAIQQQNAAIEAQFKKESDAKTGWVTVYPLFKPSLEATLTFAKQELVRLAATKSTPVVDGGRIFRDTLALIQSHGDPAKVAPEIKAARTAMVPQRYIAILEAAAAGNAVP